LNLLSAADWAALAPANGFDAILAEHVWEHLSLADGQTAARLCWHHLRPGGYLRIAVPDGYHPDPAYREYVRPGGSGAGAADHKVLYTHQILSDILTGIGFDVQLLEYFDREGQFHFADWETADGMIDRSSRFDERNRDKPLAYTSLLLDAVRPTGTPVPFREVR
jgi:predicted SAM-dependent methyltransferase